MMGTVLFTDHGILVFAMTTGAIALMHASGVGTFNNASDAL